MPYIPLVVDPTAARRGGALLFAGRPLDAGDAPADDGEAVKTWEGVDIDVDLTQATSGKRPVADDDAFPGRWAVVFTADKTLGVHPPQPLRSAMLIVRGSGSRTLLTRDTSASTTKPAYRLVIEETIG